MNECERGSEKERIGKIHNRPMPEWLHSRPSPKPAGPAAVSADGGVNSQVSRRPSSSVHPTGGSGDPSAVVAKQAGSRKPRFRTHALDHIRRKDDTGMLADAVRHSQHLLPLGVHGPADTLPSPVPTALPTDRSNSVSSLRFFIGNHRSRALSPVSPRALNPLSVNVHDAPRGARTRPASAEPSRREHRRATAGASLPRAVGRENLSHYSIAESSSSIVESSSRRPSPEQSRRRLPPPVDLDASFLSVGSVVSVALHNTSLPFSPRDDASESVEDAINLLERGQAPKTLNLRGSLDRCEMHDIERLFTHIASARSIQALNMSCNTFSDPMSWSLERLLEKNRSCLVLRLGNNRMSDKMCSSAVTALHKNTLARLVEMYMGNNQAGHLTAESIAHALRPGGGGLQNLQVLNISHNRLGDAGGAIVIEALQNNLTLRTLDLGANDLASKTRSALCKTLKFNRALREIRIERNPGLEDQGLLDILTTLRFSMHSELTMLYTVEPLGMFCMDADLSGRDTKHWDNRTVMRFLRDVRTWYGDLSTELFPISAQMWGSIHRCIKKVEKDLTSRALLGWHRVCYAHAASRYALVTCSSKGFLVNPLQPIPTSLRSSTV